MSIFRVEKNTNYTVMYNYHLRDKNLSLKTIGLLSIILSLPDNWDFSESGLAAICKDGKDSISSGLKELEKHGYLVREKARGEHGRIVGSIYHIYEVPQLRQEKNNGLQENNYVNYSSQKTDFPLSDSPLTENPLMENPSLESPTVEYPTQEKHQQIIKEVHNNDLISKESINQSILQEKCQYDRPIDRYYATVDIIKANIDYDFFVHKHNLLNRKFESGEIEVGEYERLAQEYDLRLLDQVIDYMADLITSMNNDPVRIGNEVIDRNLVKSKLMKVDFAVMKATLLKLSKTNIKNPKGYAISTLYNG